MYIRELILKNWGPYKGRHSIQLGPGVYGITARHDDDPGRSNWVGKTWLLSAIRFALHGTLPETCATRDQWISRGEDGGAVELLLSNGGHLQRFKDRGKSVRLVWTIDDEEATQDDAQRALNDLLAMTPADYAASLWVGQKQISELITMRSGKRQELVNSWLALEPLRESETFARGEARAAMKIATDIRHECARLAAQAAVEGPNLAELTEALDEAKRRRKKLLKRMERQREWEGHKRDAGRYDGIVENGLKLKAERDAIKRPSLKVLREEVEHRRSVYDDAIQATAAIGAQLRPLKEGMCPASQEACPVADRVNERCEQRASEIEAASQVEEDAAEAWMDADSRLDSAMDAHARYEQLNDRMDELRDMLDDYEASADFIEENPDPPKNVEAKVNELDRLIDQASEALGQAKAVADAAKKAADDLQVEHDAAEEAEEVVRDWLVAADLLKGARREIAERHLKQIEGVANGIIADAGIDLRMELQWEHEGGKLTPVCLECGASITGQKAKQCPNCGADRGPQMIEEMLVALTDRSGAADDIAGVMLQMAAARWLSDRKGTEWSVACIDEPFGSLDATNRHAMAKHLQNMLGGMFEQTFIVAHDASIMEALPNRIVVTRSGDVSSPKVEQ